MGGRLVPVLEAAVCKTVGSRGILRTQGSLPLFRRQPPSSSHCHVRAGWWEPAMQVSAHDIVLGTCSGSIYTALGLVWSFLPAEPVVNIYQPTWAPRDSFYLGMCGWICKFSDSSRPTESWLFM